MSGSDTAVEFVNPEEDDNVAEDDVRLSWSISGLVEAEYCPGKRWMVVAPEAVNVAPTKSE